MLDMVITFRIEVFNSTEIKLIVQIPVHLLHV